MQIQSIDSLTREQAVEQLRLEREANQELRQMLEAIGAGGVGSERVMQAVSVQSDGGLPIELRGIAKEASKGGGFWRSCSGCHELNEGHDTGPRSKVFGCALGNGCSECGGIGAIWDTTDYQAMADAMAGQKQPESGTDTMPLRQQLRNLVDAVWNEATESTTVPDTPWADRIIDKVFQFQPQPSGNSGELDERADFEKAIRRRSPNVNLHRVDTVGSRRIGEYFLEEIEACWRLWSDRAALASKSTVQDCARSHPHENMSPSCELRTEIARLNFQIAAKTSADAEDAARYPWKLIETAPKDGRTLLLGCHNALGNWRTMRGQWLSDEYIAEHWEDLDDAQAGWYEVPVEGETCWLIHPTHWTPMPKSHRRSAWAG